MPRKTASAFVSAVALAACCLAAPAAALATEEAMAGDFAPVEVEVRGLSPDDLLNIRATASPTGLVLTRIPNGSLLQRLDCADFRGYEWCRVEIDHPEHLIGWTPARYLRAGVADATEEDDAAKVPPPEKFDRSQIVAGILPDPLPSIGLDTGEESAGEEIRTVLLSPAPGSGVDPMLAFDEERESRKIDAAAPAFALAMAARNAPFAAEVFTPDGAEAATSEAPADASSLIPIPTPRPLIEGEERVAEAADEATDIAMLDTENPVAEVEAGLPAPTAEIPAEPEPAELPEEKVADTPAPAASDMPAPAVADVPEPEPANPPAQAATESPAPTMEDVPEQPVAGIEEPAEMPASEAVTVPEQEVAALEPKEESRGIVDAALAVLFPRKETPAAAAEKDEPAEPAAVITPARAAASEPSREPPAATLDPVVVAQTTTPQRSQDATIEIPCARYVGQPMTRCDASVARGENGDAEVTVLWPDGGSRVIRFRSGKPDGSNTLQEFRFTREADLNMIRIGVGERFEILDAIPLGR